MEADRYIAAVHNEAARLYFREEAAMTDDVHLPSVEEILDSTLHELDHARNVLSKAASWLQFDRRPIGSPPTGVQSRALTVASGAIDDAKAAVDRAKSALNDALRADDPPSP
jgi:hypothetical protein